LQWLPVGAVRAGKSELMTRPVSLPVGIRRVEVSNEAHISQNHMWLTVSTEHLRGRGDVALYNVEVARPGTPIVILLHGAHASYWSWIYSGGIHETYVSLKKSHGIADFVLVMPSDGLRADGTGYLPLASGDYERWIVSDVVEAVCRTLPFVNAKSRIYLAGISLGGYGALRLGAKYSGMISGISSHSPIVSLAALDPLIDGPQKRDVGVDIEDADILNWIKRAGENLPLIRFDCGKSDTLITSIRAFHDTLSMLGVVHKYDEYPGGHDWSYWSPRAVDSLLFFDQIEKSLRA